MGGLSLAQSRGESQPVTDGARMSELQRPKLMYKAGRDTLVKARTFRRSYFARTSPGKLGACATKRNKKTRLVHSRGLIINKQRRGGFFFISRALRALLFKTRTNISRYVSEAFNRPKHNSNKKRIYQSSWS